MLYKCLVSDRLTKPFYAHHDGGQAHPSFRLFGTVTTLTDASTLKPLLGGLASLTHAFAYLRLRPLPPEEVGVVIQGMDGNTRIPHHARPLFLPADSNAEFMCTHFLQASAPASPTGSALASSRPSKPSPP